MASLYTAEEAVTRWGVGAPSESRMAELLAVSEQQIFEYAPLPLPDLTTVFEEALEDEDAALMVPAGHREAHFVQARNIHNATLKAPGSQDFGPDGMAIALHPLDWHVKQLLRPRRARPVVA